MPQHYNTQSPLRVFFIGQSNISAKASFSASEPPDHSTLTDVRITTWHPTDNNWVVADSSLLHGTENAGGSGILIPQIFLEAAKYGAPSLQFISTALSAKDVDVFAPSSTTIQASGSNRWGDSVQYCNESGFEPTHVVTWVGEGDGLTVLSEADIYAHHLEIVEQCIVEFQALRRIVICIPALRFDLPAGVQSKRGAMLRAIEQVAGEYPELIAVADMARFDTHPSADGVYPHHTVSEYGQIAQVIEPLLRLSNTF